MHLFRLLNFWLTLYLAFLFSPFIFLSFVLVFPFVFTFFICSIFLGKPIRFLEMKLVNVIFEKFKYGVAKGTGKRNSSGEEKELRVDLKEKQVSLELDPMEFPSFYESDDEERAQDRMGLIRTYEKDSWQILVLESSNNAREINSFHEVLSFWKRKEKGATSKGIEE